MFEITTGAPSISNMPPLPCLVPRGATDFESSVQPEMGLSSSHGAAHADLRKVPPIRLPYASLSWNWMFRLSAASVSTENTVTWPIPDVRQSRVAPIEQDGALGSACALSTLPKVTTSPMPVGVCW